jgi:serine/threonine-protein kinase
MRDDLPKLRLGPRYRAVTLLAKGGMGAVYLARRAPIEGESVSAADGDEGELVAIKMMHWHIADDPETVAMFIDEARIGARIEHPNVIRVVDTDVADDTPFLVMEYVEGVSLYRLIRSVAEKGEKLPSDVVARIVHDALLGLEAAHAIGAIHRDVSPHNFLVGTDGRTRITDFGVATFTGRLTATAPGIARGKLGYMSPEQISRTGVDARSDVFAAGIVLWEALTGGELFTCDAQAETLAKVLREPIAPPSSFTDLPDALEDACMKALERSVDRRFPSAAAFAEALAAAAPLAPHERVAEVVLRVGAEPLERQRAAREAMAYAPRPSEREIRAADTVPAFVASDEPVSSRDRAGRPLRAIAIGAAGVVLVVLGTILGRVSSGDSAGRASFSAPSASPPAAVTTASAVMPVAPSASPTAIAAPEGPSSEQATSSSPLTRGPKRSRGRAAAAASGGHQPAATATTASTKKSDAPFIPGEL